MEEKMVQKPLKNDNVPKIVQNRQNAAKIVHNSQNVAKVVLEVAKPSQLIK